jgi:hypothetical protein
MLLSLLQDLMVEAFDRLGIDVSTINSKVVLEYMMKLKAEVNKVTDNVQAVVDEQAVNDNTSNSSAKKTIVSIIT